MVNSGENTQYCVWGWGFITERPPRFQIRRPLQTTEHSVYYYQYNTSSNWNKTDIERGFPHASTN